MAVFQDQERTLDLVLPNVNHPDRPADWLCALDIDVVEFDGRQVVLDLLDRLVDLLRLDLVLADSPLGIDVHLVSLRLPLDRHDRVLRHLCDLGRLPRIDLFGPLRDGRQDDRKRLARLGPLDPVVADLGHRFHLADERLAEALENLGRFSGLLDLNRVDEVDEELGAHGLDDGGEGRVVRVGRVHGDDAGEEGEGELVANVVDQVGEHREGDWSAN